MAYSTINHIGFILMGLIPGTEDGVTAICIYLIFYMTMNLGVFLFILNMNRDQINVSRIKDLSGLYQSQPLMAAFMVILLLVHHCQLIMEQQLMRVETIVIQELKEVEMQT